MGDPRKKKKKFSRPPHLWQKDRLEEEKVLLKDYGLKNKEELWRMKSKLKTSSDLAKNLIAIKTSQAEKEKKQLLNKLQNLGLIKKNAELEDVLGIKLTDLLEKRLQTLVFKKNMAHSVKQARQFIVHEHISVGGKKITSPSYLVSVKEEGLIGFSQDSQLSMAEHPERAKQKKKEKPKRREVRVMRRRRRR